MIFYNKQKENKIELVTRPGGDSPFLSKQGGCMSCLKSAPATKELRPDPTQGRRMTSSNEKDMY